MQEKNEMINLIGSKTNEPINKIKFANFRYSYAKTENQ